MSSTSGITQQMAALDVSAGSAQNPVNQRGKVGKPITVVSNMYPIQSKNYPVFRYDVNIVLTYSKDGVTPNEKTFDLTKTAKGGDYGLTQRYALTNHCIEEMVTRGMLIPRADFIFDRASLLYSIKKLPREEIVAKFSRADNLTFWNQFADHERLFQITVTVKRCTEGFELTIGDVKHALQTQDMTLLQFFEILLNQHALNSPKEFVCYENQAYLMDPSGAGIDVQDSNMDGGTYIGVGTHKRCKILDGPSLAVSLDVAKTPFHQDDQLISSKILAYTNGRSNLTAFDLSDINKKLKGLVVKTTYGTEQVFRIGRVISWSASEARFDIKGMGNVTMAQYYKQKYGLQLSQTSLPLIEPDTPAGRVAKKFPAELLAVAPNQRVRINQLTPKISSAVIKNASVLPDQRQSEIAKLKKAVHIDQTNPILKKFEVSVGPTPLQTQGRLLDRPSLVCGNGAFPHQNIRPNSTTYKNIAVLKSWAVIGFGVGDRELNDMVNNYATGARKKGLNLPKPKQIKAYPGDHTTHFTKIDQVFEAAKAENIPFLFIVEISTLKGHDYIKSMELKTGITTQCIAERVMKDIITGKGNTVENVLNKTNVRLGGLNYEVKSTVPWNQIGLLVIGLSVSPGTPVTDQEREKGMKSKNPSVIGFSGNYGAQTQNFPGDFRFGEPRRSEIPDEVLKEIVEFCFENYKKNHQNNLPKRVVIFRSSASDTFCEIIQKLEVACVKEACLKFGPNIPITFVCVSRGHSERFFNNLQTKNAMELNLKPGTVIDTGFVSPARREFYLNSHVALKGCAKTPKYTVLYDNPILGNDNLIALSHDLCNLYQDVYTPTGLPTPLVAATNNADRGRRMLAFGEGANSEELNVNFTNKENGLAAVRFNC